MIWCLPGNSHTAVGDLATRGQYLHILSICSEETRHSSLWSCLDRAKFRTIIRVIWAYVKMERDSLTEYDYPLPLSAQTMTSVCQWIGEHSRVLIVKGKTPFPGSWRNVCSEGCELARSPHSAAPSIPALWRLGKWGEEQGWGVLEGDSGNPATLGKVEQPRNIQSGEEKTWKDHENCLPLRWFCRVLGIKTRVSKWIPLGAGRFKEELSGNVRKDYLRGSSFSIIHSTHSYRVPASGLALSSCWECSSE